MTNEMSLLPCPFCRSQADQKFTLGQAEMYIQCTGCGVRMFGDSDLAVVEKWNRRAAAEPSVTPANYPPIEPHRPECICPTCGLRHGGCNAEHRDDAAF